MRRLVGLVLSGFLLVEVPASAQSPHGGAAAAAECANISPLVQRQCTKRRMDEKQGALDAQYARALAAVRSGHRKWGASDRRLNADHFVKAHRDWLRFVSSNCTALGAFGGGSNASVSDRIAACRERALDERLSLYRQLAEGTYRQ